jgi:hypothetical protein
VTTQQDFLRVKYWEHWRKSTNQKQKSKLKGRQKQFYPIYEAQFMVLNNLPLKKFKPADFEEVK